MPLSKGGVNESGCITPPLGVRPDGLKGLFLRKSINICERSGCLFSISNIKGFEFEGTGTSTPLMRIVTVVVDDPAFSTVLKILTKLEASGPLIHLIRRSSGLKTANELTQYAGQGTSQRPLSLAAHSTSSTGGSRRASIFVLRTPVLVGHRSHPSPFCEARCPVRGCLEKPQPEAGGLRPLRPGRGCFCCCCCSQSRRLRPEAPEAYV